MNSKRKNKFIFILSLGLIALCTFSYQIKANGETESPKVKLERHFVFDTIPLNLEEIAADADRIFAGICTNVEEIDDDPESKLPIIKYTFKITEPIKGVFGKEEITFKQWKPTVRDAGYEKGKKYVLFLLADSERGLTSPVGFLQGQFEVEKKGFIRRSEVVKNKLSNKGLNRNIRTQKRIEIKENQYINDYLQECSELGIPMRYKEFIQAVKYLVKE